MTWQLKDCAVLQCPYRFLRLKMLLFFSIIFILHLTNMRINWYSIFKPSNFCHLLFQIIFLLLLILKFLPLIIVQRHLSVFSFNWLWENHWSNSLEALHKDLKPCWRHRQMTYAVLSSTKLPQSVLFNTKISVSLPE